MTKSNCETTRAILVDYADGELSDSAATDVRHHLSGCGSCRGELTRLHGSLEHARAIWKVSASAADCRRTLRGRRSSRLEEGSLLSSLWPPPTDCQKEPVWKARTAQAVASATTLAGILAVVAVIVLSRGVWLRDARGPTQDTTVHDAPPVSSPVVIVESTEIEDLIARQARSAKLAASSEILASEPSLAEYRKQADVYLATAYENLPAGVMAKQRLQEISVTKE